MEEGFDFAVGDFIVNPLYAGMFRSPRCEGTQKDASKWGHGNTQRYFYVGSFRCSFKQRLPNQITVSTE